MPISIVLADDHPAMLAGLETLLKPFRDLKVMARCRDGEEALRAVARHRPDVLLLDIRMPVKSGLDVLRELKEQKLPTRVVILTAALEDDEVLEALRLGVNGVVLKEMAPGLLVQCIRKVAAGERWIEKRSFQSVLDKLLRREAGAQAIRGLTAREVEIVRMVVSGLRNKELADKLSISEGTVKIHLHNTYDKLKVEGRMALSVYARERGLA
jgi:two-component system, NarL family, nitrate/nitrite response regulator NarL